MVEKWLIQVEEVMINSLKKVTEDAVNAYNQTPRGKWVQEWPGQVRQRRVNFTQIGKLSRPFFFSKLTKFC